tara:strand:- start:12350 stop:12622 length:273 start_codon:yes stop_codon:yes gene_type:complete
MNQKKTLFISIILFLGIEAAFSQSNLLDNVKKNPENAIEMCNKFRALNKKGVSVNSDEALNYVSKRNNLNQINAEILSIYIIGLHCPNVI